MLVGLPDASLIGMVDDLAVGSMVGKHEGLIVRDSEGRLVGAPEVGTHEGEHVDAENESGLEAAVGT